MSGKGDLTDYTDESLFGGHLVCRQSSNGYRFSVDAVLLAHFVTAVSEARVLELGAGCGIVSLLLAHRQQSITVDAIEIQPQLSALARHNMAANGYGSRVRVLQGDVRQIPSHIVANSYDLVLANPPYHPLQQGRLCRNRERAVARHQLSGGLQSFVDAAFFALAENGRAAFVYPAEQEDELLKALEVGGLSASRLRAVYGYPGGRRRLVLVEACKQERRAEMVREPELFIARQAGGEYASEVAAWYDERALFALT